MAKEKEKSTAASGSKVRTLTFMAWAKERSVVPTAMGAAISLDIDEKKEMTEAEFSSLLDKYGKEPTAKKK